MDAILKSVKATVPFGDEVHRNGTARISHFNREVLDSSQGSITTTTFLGFASTVLPPISHDVRLGLTVAFTALYAILFLLIALQLCLILYHKHRRFSYQSVFLFVCLIWAALRTILFSFYFNDSVKANELSDLPRWLLFAFPIYLQFLTLSLLTLYLAKVVLKSRRTSLEPMKFRKYLIVAFATVNIVFLAINITSSVVCPVQSVKDGIVVARVVISGLLFFIVGIMLCFCIIKITRVPSANVLLEGLGTTTRQGIAICVVVLLLYLSRVVYNIVAVTVPHDLSSFGFGWINVSDEGEIKYSKKGVGNIRDFQFISLGVVLLVWEVIPTFMVVWFFRVRRPNVGDMGPSVIASQSYDKKFFFDNPRRYDSDEELSTAQGSTTPGSVRSAHDIPGVLSPSSSSVNVNRSRSYGSITGVRSGSLQKSSSYSNAYVPGSCRDCGGWVKDTHYKHERSSYFLHSQSNSALNLNWGTL